MRRLLKVLIIVGVVALASIGLVVWPIVSQNGSLVLLYQVQGLDGPLPFTGVYLEVNTIIIHNPGNVYNPWGGNSLITDLWRVVNIPNGGKLDMTAAETQNISLSRTTLPFGQYTQIVLMISGAYSVDASGNKTQLHAPSEIELLLGAAGKDANIAYQDAGIHIQVGHTVTVILVFTINKTALVSNDTVVISAQDQVLAST